MPRLPAEQDYGSSHSTSGRFQTPPQYHAESNHSYKGASSASSAAVSSYQPPSATTGAGGDEHEDPFEATRKRIERLKAEGAIADQPREVPPGLVDPALLGEWTTIAATGIMSGCRLPHAHCM